MKKLINHVVGAVLALVGMTLIFGAAGFGHPVAAVALAGILLKVGEKKLDKAGVLND